MYVGLSFIRGSHTEIIGSHMLLMQGVVISLVFCVEYIYNVHVGAELSNIYVQYMYIYLLPSPPSLQWVSVPQIHLSGSTQAAALQSNLRYVSEVMLVLCKESAGPFELFTC